MTDELRKAAEQALAYMKSVGEMDMYPEDWAAAMRLEAALAAAPQAEPTMFDAQFDAHCHVQGASNRQSVPDALREAARMALREMERAAPLLEMYPDDYGAAINALREALEGQR